MASVEHVEKALERLVPAALSLRASRSLEDLMDELAGNQEGSPQPDSTAITRTQGAPRRRWFGFGAAAAVPAGFLGALWLWPDRLVESPVASSPTRPDASGNLELIREVSRLESAVDEGTLADDAGGVHRVLRYRVVGEATVRGPSGDVVTVVEPRDEVVLVPVSSF